jgi:hypothetical protein
MVWDGMGWHGVGVRQARVDKVLNNAANNRSDAIDITIVRISKGRRGAYFRRTQKRVIGQTMWEQEKKGLSSVQEA